MAKPLEGAYDPTEGSLLDDILQKTRNRRSSAQNPPETASTGSNIESKPESKPESNIVSLPTILQESQSVGLQTDKLTSQADYQQDGLPVRQTANRQTTQMTNQTAYQSGGLPDDQSAYQIVGNQQSGLSMRERLLMEARGKVPVSKPVLKPVTLKIDPALDSRIDAHCHATGKKKQDVIADALLLYFETVEGA